MVVARGERSDEARRDIVAVGGSAGAIEALTELVRALPHDLPASVFVVVHVPPNAVSSLPEILRRSGPLPALHAADGDPIYRGRVYVAPPDRHLLVYPRRIRLSRGPHENRNRPAIDPLFRTAAHSFRSRVTAVLLSGTLDDGTDGLGRVRRESGLALAQDPGEATFPQMPRSAIDAGNVDRVATVRELAEIIDTQARTGVAVAAPAGSTGDVLERRPHDTIDRANDAAPYGCPECGGALWLERNDPAVLRCRVGHSFSEESLAAGQDENTERALWAAARALAERVSLGKRMARRSERAHHTTLARRYLDEVNEAERNLAIIERVLFGVREASEADLAEEEPA